MPSLESVLASIPGIAGFEASRQRREQGDLAQLQQVGALQKILGQVQAQQEEQQLRQSLVGAKTPAEAIERLIASGHPKAIAIAAKLKALQPQPQSIGSGGLLMPEGKIIPPAARPEGFKAPPMRTRVIGDQQVQEELQTDGTWKEVGKGPRFAKQVGPTVISPPAVTTKDIVDPADPTRLLAVDARTYKGGTLGAVGVIGVSGKVGDAQKAVIKRQIASQGVGSAIERARDILEGKGGAELPTESGAGAALDVAASWVGVTPKGAKSADRLRVVGGFLVQKVPRFEGPQSDKDVAYYKEVAGRIGDAGIPIARRLEALKEVENIWGEFEGGKKFGYFQLTGPSNTASGNITPARRADDVPPGIDPKVWGAMTPEEKKLFK